MGVLKSGENGSKPALTLCHPGKMDEPLCVTVTSSVKWEYVVLKPWLNFQVKSETGPSTRRMRRDRRKRQTTPDWQVTGLISKGAYSQGLSWGPQDEQTSVPARQYLKSVYRGLNGVQSLIPSSSQNNTLLCQGCVLETTLVQEERAECTLQGQARGEEPLIVWVQLSGQPVVTSSP